MTDRYHDSFPETIIEICVSWRELNAKYFVNVQGEDNEIGTEFSVISTWNTYCWAFQRKQNHKNLNIATQELMKHLAINLPNYVH